MIAKVGLGTVLGQSRTFSGKFYGVEQGLPSSAVYSIMEDHNGYVWFGTDAGIARFDGYEFTTIAVHDGLPDNAIFGLFEDHQNRVWYIPFNSQIGYVENGKVYDYPYNNILQSTVVSNDDWLGHIVIDSTYTLKFATRRGLYGQIDAQGKLTIFEMNLLENGNSELGNLNHFPPKVVPYTARNKNVSGKYEPQYVFRLDETSYLLAEGNWIYFEGDSLYRNLDGEKNINRALVDENNRLWVAIVGNGLQVYASIEDFMQQRPPLLHLLEEINVSYMWMNENGELWVTTENQGVYYYPNSNLDVYRFDVPNKNRITAISRGTDGTFFFGNGIGELYQTEINAKKTVQLAKTHAGVNQLTLLGRDSLLISYYGSDMSKGVYNRNSIDITGFSGRDAIKDCDSGYWVVRYTGVTYDYNDKVIFNSVDQLGNQFFNCVFQSEDGTVWAGANSGLYQYQNGQMVSKKSWFKEGNNLKIRTIIELNDGTLILGTSGLGLYASEKRGNGLFFKKIGLDGYLFKQLCVDREEALWAATNKGVLRVEKMPGNQLKVNQVSIHHGLPSNEVNTIDVNDKNVYIGTNAGWVVFNKEKVTINKAPVLPQINLVRVNGKKMKTRVKNHYTLKYDQNYITIDFSALAYKTFGTVLYSYQMVGIDNQWQFSKDRGVRYPALDPGNYTFKLRAANEDGIWSPVKEISFQIRSPFWKEGPFVGLSVIMGFFVVLIGYFSFKRIRDNKLIRSREMERQKREVIEAELKALRAQMNPHFTFNTLNSIQSFILDFDQQKAMEYINKFSLLLRKILENSSFSVVSLSEEIAMLKLYLELENLRFDNSIETAFYLDERIDAEFTEIPSMIMQPFVENAVLHGLSGKKTGDKKLKIEINKGEDKIYCVIEDTGIGRQASSEIVKQKKHLHKPLGLKITYDRIAFFNRQRGCNEAYRIIDLFDRKDKNIGTRVEITLAVK